MHHVLHEAASTSHHEFIVKTGQDIPIPTIDAAGERQ
jgi:hypothetical protein